MSKKGDKIPIIPDTPCFKTIPHPPPNPYFPDTPLSTFTTELGEVKTIPNSESPEFTYLKVTKDRIEDIECMINNIIKEIEKINDYINYTKANITQEPEEYERHMFTVVRLKRDRKFLEQRIEILYDTINLMKESIVDDNVVVYSLSSLLSNKSAE
jgi:hypothetical protein